ncbi:MAG: pitrilysin family protein [Methylovirgula sp.]|uniref:M16 family metallopeptidase n=1 Tax=Methylovirgula sp. TaxID=1978224 RepID=UPI003075FF99
MSVEITTLPSGLRIVTDRMPHLETVSLGVWVAAGSRHERPRERGLSHLLEHMAFKGTRRRSARDIAEEIESAGGDLNAATGVEQTAYYAHMLASDAGLAIDILADILTDSVFDKDELEREKEVILQEIGAVEDTPDDLVFDLFNAAAFPEQPIGWPILGTPEHVKAFDRSMISNYLAKHYRSGVTTIGAAGALDHAQIVDAAAARFANMSAQVGEAVTPARYLGGDTRLSRRLEQAHVVIGFEGLSYAAPGYYALQVFTNAVGGGMSSRLFQEVRENRGLAYTVYSFHWGYADTGLFGFYGATSKAQVRELVPVALECLAKAAEDLSEAEIDRAKAQMKVSQLTALESSTARSEQIARQILAYGRVLSRDEILARIDNLTVSEIRAAGAAALRTVPTVAAVGPVAKVHTPDRIRELVGGA